MNDIRNKYFKCTFGDLLNALAAQIRSCSPAMMVVSLLLMIPASPLLGQSSADKAWKLLKSALSDNDVEQRATAARVLGLIADNKEATDMALSALADKRSEVRAGAATALGRMGAKSAAAALEAQLTKETDPAVVIAGARALIVLGDSNGYRVYYAVLTGEKKSGESLVEAQKKMLDDPKKLAKLGFEQGIGFIPFAGIGYGALKALTKDDVSPIRAAAAKVLADDPDPKSAEALVAAASDKSWIVRAAALDALSQRDDPSLLPKIEPGMNDDKPAVRLTAAAAAIHLGDVASGKVAKKTKE